MREHQELLSANQPIVGQKTHGVFKEAVPVPRPERGGGQVLFFEGSWLGLLERLWFVAPFYLVDRKRA